MAIELPIFQVDAFTDRVFGGNPAAVCPLDTWLPNDTLAAIAAENNLSETAYLVREGPGDYHLRWFTPAVEVELCGHATLASGHVVLGSLDPSLTAVRFSTRSGLLTVSRDADRYALDLPASRAEPVAPPDPAITTAIGRSPREVLCGRQHVAVLDDEAAVRAIVPDLAVIARLGRDGFIVTAPGDEVDFVSRFFAPHQGIDEDPVTGSAHCTLAPYWADRLGRTTLSARQVSARGGDLECTVAGDRVTLRGSCRSFMRGTITLP